MSDDRGDPQAIFFRAIEIAPTEERQAYLDQACQGDNDLRTKVEGLIRSYQAAGSFLEIPIVQLPEADLSDYWDAANATNVISTS